MNFLRNIPMASLAVGGGGIAAIGWVTMEGTVPLVISMLVGILMALKATLDDGDDE